MTYDIYRNATLVATVSPTGTQDNKIMGGNTVSMSFELPEQTAFEVGDHVDVYGERYYINYAASEREVSADRWSYGITFQVSQYDLAKPTYFGYNSANQLTLPDHPLTGTANTFIDLLIANLNRGIGGYSKGTIDETDTRTLQFTGENCLAVLSRLAEEFKTEFWVEGKVVHLSKRGEVLPVTLKYGQGNGLRGIERVPVDENPPVTHLYVYGSTKNLPTSYRGGNRLQLPISGAPLGYIHNPIPNFYNELIYTNENIYPERVGTVSASGAINSFSDTALDFDINTQLIPGVTAKVKFISGALSGYEFEISSYNHTTRTITFNPNKDEKAFTVPSESQRPAVGDKWVIFDVFLPQYYIDDAEARLLADGLEYKEQNTGVKYNFNLTTDPFHFQREGVYLSLGKYLTLVSDEWGINGTIRIVGYTRDLQDPYVYPSVEVSHAIRFSPAVVADTKQRDLVKDVNNATKVTKRVGDLAFKSLVEKALLGETIIEGGYILTELIDVVTLIVQNLITGKVRITAEDNNIRIVETDAGGVESDLVVIDDDVANNGDTESGAGMRIGVKNTTNYSQTGRWGHQIFAADGTLLSHVVGQDSVNKIGLYTKSALVVEGLSSLHNLTFNGYLRPDIGDGEAYLGFTGTEDVRVGGDQFKRFKWVKGILVSITAAT